ncbi:acyltransferase family protein [Marimonas arenosa]|uniref:acyltransferase family protein n=1 Tax=Marimonas arenosa TaxID=1795305 RepID=UPI0027D21DB1|nr:acyltransferase family protein [Marimonas arenosa]
MDGLRMIAVLGVVLYHFGVPGLPGGFTGVDVFFVISGFLIGGILWRNLEETGSISLARFYTRRVKRLAPAFFAMAAASALVAWVVLLPFEFREFGKELIAATTYLSNVLFWRGEGYFDIGAENKVLLHTWSLAVEEQFYIVLPVLMLALARWRRLLVALLVVLFVGSLTANIALSPTDQTTTFYLFPFRAWELLAGVLLAVAGHSRGFSYVLRPGLSYAGLALVLAGLTLVAPQGFPGWQALFPVLGTTLLIANGKDDNRVNRALAAPLPVFIGKISYSLYLWHWPVLVLSRYWRDGYAGPLEAALWLALAFALAILSWALIETPFRRTHPRSGWRVLAALAAPSAAALGIGALAYVKDGLPARFAPETRAYIAASADFNQDWSRCHTPAQSPFKNVELCPIGPEGLPEVIVWGDSHLRAIKEVLEQAAFDTDTPALIIWHAGCPPVFGISKQESYATPAEDAACAAGTAEIRRSLASLAQARTLLLVARWAYYADGAGSGRDAHNTIRLAGLGGSTNREVLSRALAETLPELRRHFPRLFLLRQPPEIPDYDSRETARRLAYGRVLPTETPTDVSRTVAETRAAGAEALFAPYLAEGSLRLIDPWPVLCTAEKCSARHGDAIWYFDNNHLTNTAARAFAGLISPVFEVKN